MLKLNLIPIKNGLLKNSSNTIEVLATISTSSEETYLPSKNIPLDLGITIDRSGSMEGRPLDQVKSCVSRIVDQMAKDDSLAIIAYDDAASIVLSRQNISDREKIASNLAKIFSGGTTDIFLGWNTTCKEFAIEPSANRHSRIILLSDGMANRGLTEFSAIGRYVNDAYKRGIKTSTYGIGHSFNEQLMTAMAAAGGGKSYYGHNAEDLMNPFLEELELIRSIIANNVSLGITTQYDFKIEVLNNYLKQGNGKYMLPDLASGGEVWALIRVHIDQLDDQYIKDGQIKLFTADLGARDVEQNHWAEIAVPFHLPVLDNNAWQQLQANEKVSMRKFELLAAAEQIKAYNAAMNENWDIVQCSLEKLDELGRVNKWISASTDKLRNYACQQQKEAFTKEAHFKSIAYSQRIIPTCEPDWAGSDKNEKTLPSYLRRKIEEGKR